MRYAYYALAFLVVAVLSLAGFRGCTSTRSPIELIDDMVRQPKYKAQARSAFFADGRTDRPLPPNTVARGDLQSDDHRYLGKNADGSFARGFPAALPVTHELIARGQQRFTIYCAPCHGALGDGQGITKAYGMAATPTYHDDRLRQMAEGEIFATITKGKNTMMPYADKLPADDRWAVIAYLRALQRSQNGREADVPASARAQLATK
jgi:mono/diheme cytochrome c family protein